MEVSEPKLKSTFDGYERLKKDIIRGVFPAGQSC